MLAEEPLATGWAGLLLCLPALRDLDLGGLAKEAAWPAASDWAPGRGLDALLLAKLAGLGGAFYGAAQLPGSLLYLLAGLGGTADPAALLRYVAAREDEAVRRLQVLLARRRRELGIGDARFVSIARRRMTGLSRAASPLASGLEGRVASVILLRELRGRHLLLDAWSEEEGAETPARLLDALRNLPDSGSRLLVCGARMLSYDELALLDRAGWRFITHRRRGEKWLDGLAHRGKARPVTIPGQLVALRGDLIEAPAALRPFERELRQIVFQPAGQTVHGRESLTLLTNLPSESRDGVAGTAAEEIIRDYLAHDRLQRRLPGEAGWFTPGEAGAQDEGGAAAAEGSYLHPRLGSRAWPVQLPIDLVLTQAAEAAAILLARRLSGSEAAGASGLLGVDLQRPGVLRREPDCLRLSTGDLQLYQTLQRWLRAGAFAGCPCLPAGGLMAELLD